MAGTSEFAEDNPLRAYLPRTKAPDPCSLVLFGATGDLAHRKLVPALYKLALSGQLPTDCALVGFGRRDWNDEQFREQLKASAATENGPPAEAEWSQFASHVFFCEGSFDDEKAFQSLRDRLEQIDAMHNTHGNQLFYLAVAPEFFATIIDQLGKAGLIYPHQHCFKISAMRKRNAPGAGSSSRSRSATTSRAPAP